jgi:chemotaxis protein CheD
MTEDGQDHAEEKVQHVRIGEIRTASTGILKATLGSCVGIALIHPRTHLCGLAHCFLPLAPAGVASTDARYADRAVANLLLKVAPDPTRRRGLRAFITGGGRMLNEEADSRLQVGQLNVEAVRASLKELHIRFSELHIGEFAGCNAILDCDQLTFSSETINVMAKVEKESAWN